jgi:Cd2+/Zn2+-exporting ATPase
VTTSASAPRIDAVGCDHCEDHAPAPTGARVRGWFTATAAALVIIGCAFGGLTTRPWWSAPLFVAAALIGTVFPAQRAVQSLRKRRLDINALMVVAVIGAIAIGEREEAAMVVSLFAAAQWLEAQSLDRARQAISGLLDLVPSEVLVREEAGERRIALDLVAPGALMIVRPGDRIALDGVVTTGRSDVNQAPITGESMPVEKAEGDEVFAGTINGHGALVVAVTRRRADTALARIVHLVESAQAQRAPTQLFIDRFAAWYTPAVVILAALVATVPVALFGQAFDVWLYRSLVLLVVACPCALVISTPVSIVSALAGAARHGVLVKGGAHLERLASVRVVAFDKTGTVTTGKLHVGATYPAGGRTEAEVLETAASVESQSEHPIAAAVLRAAHDRGIATRTPNDVRALPGLGVEGRVGNTTVVCGTPRLFAERGWLTPAWQAVEDDLSQRGMSPVLVACDGAVIGALGLSDQPRTEAAAVVAELRRDGISRVVMITGDHEPAARAIAFQVGADEVRAAQLPQDKVDSVAALRRSHGPVAMIGDGINDAPALAAADVGIAMGAMGSAAALETADVALMTDELTKVPYVIRLSRATLANIRVNVAISLGLKAAFVVLAIAGVATLWMAVLADTGASALVVANAVRLRKFR